MPNTTRAAQSRRTETPNATMTTLASPSLNGTVELSLWAVAMRAGQRGPSHSFDSEQIWTVLEGELVVEVEGETATLHSGDTVVFPGSVVRQVTATAASRMLVCGRGDTNATVPGEDTPRGTPDWIA